MASACRLAIEKDGLGCEPLVISAEITASNLDAAELIRRFLPGVEIRRPITGRQAFFNTDRAQKLLDWKPRHVLPI